MAVHELDQLVAIPDRAERPIASYAQTSPRRLAPPKSKFLLVKETARSLNSMVYGIICFGTLFSLVGTILGGIWADQSWGRFWG